MYICAMKKTIITTFAILMLFGCTKEKSQYCECTVTKYAIVVGGSPRQIDNPTTVMMPRIDGDCSHNEGPRNQIYMESYELVKCK